MGKSLGTNASLEEYLMKYITTILDQVFEIEILKDNKVMVNGDEYEVDFETVPGQMVYSLLVNGKSFEAHVNQGEEDWMVLLQGTLYNAEVIDEREKRLRDASKDEGGEGSSFSLLAPMPGLIVKVPVVEGDTVEKGEVLVILESMKMQNELKSPINGKVNTISVMEGENIDKKQILLIVEPLEKEE